MANYDTFWTREYRGWWIHSKHDRDNHCEVLTITDNQHKPVRHSARTLEGCKRVIRRKQQEC